MSEELLALLARLNEPGDNPLTDDELSTLLEGLRAHAEELRNADRTEEVVAELGQIADGVEAVRAEQATRAAAATARDEAAEAALSRILAGEETDEAGDDTSDGEDGDGDATTDTAPEGDTPPAGTAPDATAAAPEATPIAASARRPQLSAVRAPAPARRTAPAQPETARATATLTAAGDLPGYSAGTEVPSIDELGAAMARKLRSMGPRGGSVLVASLRTEFPEERMLRKGDAAGNDEKIRKVTAPEALTASGGICGPLAVDYSVPTFATAERPVRDALVRFGAERGGILFTTPPKIGDVAAATGIWTEAIDAGSPGNSDTKVKLQVACGSTESVEVDAVTTILEFGNMQGRFYPEYVTAQTENAIAAAARVAEVNLLNKIHAASTEVTLVPSVGAGRGTLEVLGQAIAAIRYRMRLSDQARFRVIPPRFLLDMIMVDFAKELPSGTDRLAITEQIVEDYLAARNTTASWALDGVAAQGTGNTYPDQTFAAQASGALTAWPTKVVFPIFPEGSFQFLDGGELNLGVVRDSTLNSTNDYETFVETFENVAFRGIESLWAIATLVPTGASSGTITPANP